MIGPNKLGEPRGVEARGAVAVSGASGIAPNKPLQRTGPALWRFGVSCLSSRPGR
jgi:hypothetical protein